MRPKADGGVAHFYTVVTAETVEQTFAHKRQRFLAEQGYTYDIVDAMQRDAGITLRELKVDGGAARNNLLMQFQADLLGERVIRPRVTETTALGAACLAGLGVGFWPSQDAVAAHWRLERRFEPAMSRDEAAGRMDRWARAVERSRGWHVDT